MRPSKLVVSCLALLAASAIATSSNAGGQPIQIVSAYFGRTSATRPYDFTERLQAICGPSSSACEAFCSTAAIGARRGFSLPLSSPPICRVVYRCGADETKATDANENDTLYLRCRDER